MTILEILTSFYNKIKNVFCMRKNCVTTLTSDSNEDALAGSQGKVLDGKITTLESSVNDKLAKKLNLSGGTVTGTVKFDSQPQSKYGDNYYTIPFNRGGNLISFLWTTSGLNIYVDTTLIGSLPNGFSNTAFKVKGMNFGDDIYIYNDGNGQLYCRTGTSGNYSYKQLAP